MKRFYLSFFAFLLLLPFITSIEARYNIPKEFHGSWANDCREPGDESLDIASTTISPYEGQCTVISGSSRSKTNLSGKVKCSVEGSEAQGIFSLSIKNNTLSYSIESRGDIYHYEGKLKKCH